MWFRLFRRARVVTVDARVAALENRVADQEMQLRGLRLALENLQMCVAVVGDATFGDHIPGEHKPKMEPSEDDLRRITEIAREVH